MSLSADAAQTLSERIVPIEIDIMSIEDRGALQEFLKRDKNRIEYIEQLMRDLYYEWESWPSWIRKRFRNYWDEDVDDIDDLDEDDDYDE